MDKEYIERGELLNIEKLLNTDIVQKSKTASFLYGQMMFDIENIPASDVVQIVRCKDCKYYEKITNTGKNGCEMWCCRCGALAKIKQDGESFCSYGERREQ